MNFLRPVVVVVVAASLPFFAACGARVAGEPENEQSHEGATAVLTDTGPHESDVGASPSACAPTEFGKIQKGSGCFPCLSNTAAYYSEPGPPPATGGCRDLYTPTTRHSAGTVISIVFPSVGDISCSTVACSCSESGRWEPSSSGLCPR